MLLVFLVVFLGLFAAPVSPKSRLCKQATTQTMRELKNEYDSYMGDAEGQKSVRKIMVVREEACGSVFPKMYLNDDNRPMVSQSDRCKPEEFADCIYGEADEDNLARKTTTTTSTTTTATTTITTSVDYIALVRKWNRADVERMWSEVKERPEVEQKKFLRNLRTWELVCGQEAPQDIWDAVESKPLPREHKPDVDRDPRKCVNLETTTTSASTTTINYVALVRTWSHADIGRMWDKAMGKSQQEKNEFYVLVATWEEICGVEAEKAIWEDRRRGGGDNRKPLSKRHKPEERIAEKCVNIERTTVRPTTTTSSATASERSSTATEATLPSSPLTSSSGNKECVKLMRTWCTPHATEEFKNVRDRNPKPSEAEINHSRRIMRLWELICKEDLDVQEVWSGVTAKPEPLPHDQKERDGNCAEECDDSVFDRSNAERLEVTKKINSICKVDGHDVTTTKVLTATTKTDRRRTERSTTTTSLSTTTEATASTTTTYAVPEETTTLPIRTPPPDLSTTLTSKWIYPSTEASHQCHECFQPYAWCEVNATIPGVCEKCACPHGRTGSCCETIIDFCAVEGADPCKDDTLDMHRQCEVNWVSGWTRCVCNSGWEGRNCTEKILACEANRCVNGGTCVDDEKGNFTCTCLPEYKGRFCEMKSECHPRCYPCVQDDPRCKHGSSCWPNNNATKDDHFKCICERGFKGEFCEEDIPCVTRNPCKNGGECYRENGKAVCECMSIWTGDFCETFNICYNERYKCGGGVCEAINATSFRCNCFVSYTGEFCEEQVNFCDPNPCLNNMTCARLEGGFNCICGEGTTGRFCEDDHNDCEIEENGAKLKNRCSRRDKKAKCFDQVNDFFCECSQKWVGKECTMRREIYDVLKHFKTYDDGTVKMLEDILDKPELIKETLPFFLALQPNQSTISWEHGDLFEWASFEGRELDVATDLVKWNEATLGNCFTFNHESRPQKFGLRYNGEREGFRTALNLRQDEYLSWIDTASILVFVHPHTETIFGESLRFQAKPGGQTSIMTSLVSYERLGGSYGRCVSDNSEIDSYYYSGDYTTDGCLRSCYQDAVFKECKCMDPRFPLKEDVEVCDLSKRICAVGLTQRRGDPSNWPECNCPLPCTNGQFNVRWSRTSFGNMTENCDKTIQVKESRERCVRRADRVEIFVSMPYIIQNIYKEEPKTDFNKFIANLGGLLGILCGICIITLIEFAYLIVRLFVFLCFGK